MVPPARLCRSVYLGSHVSSWTTALLRGPSALVLPGSRLETQYQVPPRPFESDAAFQQYPPESSQARESLCWSVFRQGSSSLQSCLQVGELYGSQPSGNVCSQPLSRPPSASPLLQGEHFRVPTELPGPEVAAVGRAQLIASGSPDVDYAAINKGLETSGNQKLALAGWAFHLLPDRRLPWRLWPGPGPL